MWHFLLDTTLWVCVSLSDLDTAGLRPWWHCGFEWLRWICSPSLPPPPSALSLSLTFDLFVLPCHRISLCLLLCGSQDQTQAIKSGSKYLSH